MGEIGKRPWLSLAALAAATALSGPAMAQTSEPTPGRWTLVIHGGAGVAAREALSAEREAEMRAALEQSLLAGQAAFAGGGDSVAAVEAAVRVLEDSPLFNAGRGAALDETGTARHDAAVMRGRDHAVGAIAGSTRIRNPITAARRLIEGDGPVMLAGDGADWFAAREGLDLADPLYFQTDQRREALLRQRRRDLTGTEQAMIEPETVFGTVGAVAVDAQGHLAAATSTGGRTNKMYGRIGDSPIIGSGTYADAGCAVSATGHGEYFIRWTVARDICARAQFGEEAVPDAAQAVIDDLGRMGGDGAVIAIDRQGRIGLAMNGRGMYRGVLVQGDAPRTAIYRDESLRPPQ